MTKKSYDDEKDLLTDDNQKTLTFRTENYEPYGGSKWDGVADTLSERLLSTNYNDWTKGEQYKALADRYMKNGQLAMQDVLGQISTRTGGLASSYATTAAQQQYNGYMQDLESVAREMYGAERGELLENAQLAQSLSQADYGKYLDALDKHNADRNFGYNAFRDSVGGLFNVESMKYQKEQDGIANDLNRDRFNHEVSQDAWNQNAALAEMLAPTGNFSGYKNLGVTDADITAMQDYFKAQGEQAAMESDREWLFEIGKAIASETGDTSLLESLATQGNNAEAAVDFGSLMEKASVIMSEENPAAAEKEIQKLIDANWDSMTEDQQEQLIKLIKEYGFAE